MLRRVRFISILGSAALLSAALLFSAVGGSQPKADAPQEHASGGVFSVPVVHAQVNLGLEPVGRTLGLGTQDIRVTVANIIRVALTVVGVIVLILVIYGGFLYMTAGGNEETVTKAKRVLVNSVIGLGIILSAYAITAFIIAQLLGATTGNFGGAGFEQQAVARFSDFSSGSLGEGIVQSHYPSPGATDIPRNTKIIVTFKVPMDPATIIVSGKINPTSIKLIKSADISAGGVGQTAASKFITDVAAATIDNRTFVFIPSTFLGSPSERVSYTVKLEGGATGLKKSDGSLAFSGNYADGYKWEFETSTVIDTTAPKVVSYYPKTGAQSVARNSIIQVNFDEAVDPVTAAGAVPPLQNMKVMDGQTEVSGTWEIGNQYKTIEFRSNQLAGTNACGANVYVLPANRALTVTARAATLGPEPPQAAPPYPYDGVTDIAGNSLDGNANSTAQGPSADSLVWSFSTSETVDTTGPKVVSVEPGIDASKVDISKPVSLIFSEPLSLTTVSNATLHFNWRPASASFWYYGAAQNLDSNGDPVISLTQDVFQTRADIVHQTLAPSVSGCSAGARQGDTCTVDSDCPGGACATLRFDYYPTATEGVQDLNQNCFYPACGENPQYPYCCSGVACSVSCQTSDAGTVVCRGK
jgi:hypothetical protein